MVLNRSGNRGECLGLCRLPYKMISDDKMLPTKHYFSLKDLCTINYINELIDIGVTSLKIEGRMKSPEYVGYMTKIYRSIVDAYYNGEKRTVTEEEYKNIQLLFNRGLTKGFLASSKNDAMVNTENPNHIGIHLGKYKVLSKKIEITLDEELNQGDTIRFKEAKKGMTINFLYDKKDNLINSSSQGNVVYVDNFLDIKGYGEVRKVGSVALKNEIDNIPKRQISIDGKIEILRNKPIRFTVSDRKSFVNIESTIPEPAKTRATTKEEVKKQLCKTGATIYTFDNLEIVLDYNLFVNIKVLNELRRNSLEKLNVIRMNYKKETVFKEIKATHVDGYRDFALNVSISTIEQFSVAKKYATNIFTSDIKLYEKLKNEVYPKLEEKAVIVDKDKYIVKDYGTLVNIKESDSVHTDYMLNVTNSKTVETLEKLGASTICLSLEANTSDIKDISLNSNKGLLEVFIYGYIELMKMKFDPNSNGDITYIIDRNNKKYLLRKNKNYNYLMSSEPLDRIQNIEEFKEYGIKNFRVDFLDENSEFCEKVLSNIHKKIFKE